MSFELRLCAAPVYSVRTRVIMELQQFPATVRELEQAGCGSPSQIRRVLCKLEGLVRLQGARYAFKSAEKYKLL